MILDSKWLHSISRLRDLDQQNLLVCQGCQQPVRVRAGEQREWHFAHKHLENCDYADESAILRNSRAVLYEWLVSKFGNSVTVEKKLDGVELFRPIDCWVETDEAIFAYWIFDHRLKSEKRDILENLSIHVHWVFVVENMVRREPDHTDRLVLSTTEREFIRPSTYDEAYGSGYSINTFSPSLERIFGRRLSLELLGSLHYLDAENRKLLTFRGLSLYHEPQVYEGHAVSSDLRELLVSPRNGEFVHRGEHKMRFPKP